MLEKVKMALRLTGAGFDPEIRDLIDEALTDLDMIGIDTGNDADPLILSAVKLYSRLHFGEPDDYDRLDKAYHELKGQLKLSSRYQRGEADG